MRIDNKHAEASSTVTFPEGGETINATTMLPSQDAVQPGVETRLAVTIKKDVQAPRGARVHTLDDDDVTLETVIGPRTRKRHTWSRDRSRSKGSAETARSSLERPKRQSDLSRNKWAKALEEARRQQEIKQRKEAESRREKANTKERQEKNRRGDVTKRGENGEEAVANERREEEPAVYKSRWALAMEESRADMKQSNRQMPKKTGSHRGAKT